MTAGRRRVVFFTAQEIGFRLTEFAAGREDLDALFVTRMTLNDQINGYRCAIDACQKHGLRCLVAPRVDEAVREAVREHKPELIVSAYYPVVIPAEVIALSGGGAVNVHPGILPHYRGRFPTPWYILNGAERFGVAIHRIDGGIDTGEVLLQETFPLSREETGHGLYRRAMDEAARLLTENFDALLDGRLSSFPQECVGSYYATIEKRFHIDWNVSCEQVARRVRVHARPYFPAYSFLNNRVVLIERVRPLEISGYTAQGAGRIVQLFEGGRFAVSCSDGCLLVEAYTVAPELTDEDRHLHLRVGNVFE